jgi:hypothetical protein
VLKLIEGNKEVFDFLYKVMIVFAIVFILFATFYIYVNIEALKQNPFIYGAKQIGNIECTCYRFGDTAGKQYVPFAFNSTSFWNVGYEQENIINWTYNPPSKEGN